MCTGFPVGYMPRLVLAAIACSPDSLPENLVLILAYAINLQLSSNSFARRLT